MQSSNNKARVNIWAAALVATAVTTVSVQSYAKEPGTVGLPESAMSSVEASVSDASEMPLDNAAASTTMPDKKMSLEQLRAAMAEAEKQRNAALAPDPGVDNKSLREKWGVEVIGVSRSLSGYMLNFRFRVLDADKALPLFDHRIKPYLLPAKANIKLGVPVGAKTGAMRPTNRGQNIKSDKSYYMVFANPDSFVKAGEKVSVIIGEFKAENVKVK